MEHLAHAEAGHSFSLGALSPDRRTHCINFLAERFDKLNALEQSLILANLQAIRDKTITRARRAAGDKGARFHAQNRLEGAVNLFKNRSAQLREILFRNLVISSPEALEKVAGLFLDQHKSYLPAILAALNAAYNGEDIGILTSRGNRKGNRELLRAIESFLGFSIPRRNIYFVNDTSRNQRLKERSSAGKKLEVLIDFALGFYRDRHGRIRGLSKTYDLVLFYDDEPKNLDLVNLHARKMGLAKCLRAIDSTKLAVTGLWMSLVDKVERGLKPHLGQKRIIRFFDLDGTLAETDSLLRVVRRGDGKEVMLVTPEEYAEEPTREYWEDRAAKQNPDTPREDLQLSFLEFEEESRITRRVRERLRHNELFKRKLKSWDPARSAG